MVQFFYRDVPKRRRPAACPRDAEILLHQWIPLTSRGASTCSFVKIKNFIIKFKVTLLFLWLIPTSFAAPSFLTSSDIHYGSQNTSADGQDTGDEFLAIAMNKFKQLAKNVDFILNLGDLPTHMYFVSPRKEEYEKTVFHALYEADSYLKPMFYITGNNDSLSGNYQPFEKDGKSPLNFATDWTGACVHCEGLIIDDTHMRDGGYYSSYVIPGNKEIILIALNSMQWTNLSFFLRYANQQQAAYQQLFWLKQQLKKLKGKQLILAMHVPPGRAYNGLEYWHRPFLDSFINILEHHKSSFGQITLLTAHTHMDEFRKIRFHDGSAIFVYSTPSISRIHHNNPGMKVFRLDAQLRIKDFVTYYTSDLNSWGNEQYNALGNSGAMFPNCHKFTLAQCLEHQTREVICNQMELGLFSGVKSTHVKPQACIIKYLVNSLNKKVYNF
jgi:alkaline phosphatase D